MDRSWQHLIGAISGGKRVGGSIYLHASAITGSADVIVERARQLAVSADFDVVKIALSTPRVSLLQYPGFFDEAFPTLTASWSVDLDSGGVRHRTYPSDANAPVLHRKELLLDENHPDWKRFAALTTTAEAAGLFDDPDIIGHRVQWEEEIRARGLCLDGHKLARRGMGAGDEPSERVERHRTALHRRSLSTPMQVLFQYGYLDGRLSVFDYGCGRGDDIAAVGALGVSIAGWDPHFRPAAAKVEGDVVNLGFVLNVIDDLQERRDALVGAWALTRHVLAVAALIGGRTAWERHRLYRDGVLTTRSTFQKYFTHAELGEYVGSRVGREPVSVAPGVYLVFRTDEGEQDFLDRRQRSRHRFTSAPRQAVRARERAPTHHTSKPMRRPTARLRWELHSELLEEFWRRCLDLGRLPVATEYDREPELRRRLGTPKVVLRHLIDVHGEAPLAEARARRRDDLSVFMALNLFERRRSMSALPPPLQADVRSHWGSFKVALGEAHDLLFSISGPDVVEAACLAATTRGLGYYVAGELLQLDTRLVNDLPPVLRVYLGCAGKLYGEMQAADVVKLHSGSGKVSVMSYDDYAGRVIPDLIERVKVDLRRQRIAFFQYGEEFEPQPLYLKSRYMSPDLEGYEHQRAFDDALETLGLFDFSGFGPSREEMEKGLADAGYAVRGGALVAVSD